MVKMSTDNQGNPLDENGKLIVEKVSSIDELTDGDFTEPYRSVELPKIPDNVDEAIGADGKPAVIKKNVFEKNGRHHKFTPQESRNILTAASLSTLPYGLSFANKGSENSETSKWKNL